MLFLYILYHKYYFYHAIINNNADRYIKSITIFLIFKSYYMYQQVLLILLVIKPYYIQYDDIIISYDITDTILKYVITYMLFTVNYEKNNQSDKSDMEVFLLNFVLSVYNMIYNHYALKCAYIFLALTWSALICNIIHQWIHNTKLSTMAQIRNMTNDVGLSSKYFYMYLILLSYYYSCFCVYYHIGILQALLINIICTNSMRVLTTATTTSIIICNYDYSILITTHYSYTRTCNLLLPCHAYIIDIVPFLFKSTLAYDSFKTKIVIHVGNVNTCSKSIHLIILILLNYTCKGY